VLGCLEEKFWQEFCRAIAREDLIEDQFVAGPRQDEMITEIQRILLQKTRQECWISCLIMTPVSPRSTLSKKPCRIPIFGIGASGSKRNIPSTVRSASRVFSIKFSEDQPGWRTHPPSFGEHTREILLQMGYNEAAVDDLAEKGVI